MKLDLYFPTPIWSTELFIDNDVLLKYIYRLRDDDPEGRTISNRGGWQSKEFDGQDVPELRDAIFPCLNRCITDYGYEPDGLAFKWGNSWANINTQRDVNQVHVHHGSFYLAYIMSLHLKDLVMFYSFKILTETILLRVLRRLKSIQDYLVVMFLTNPILVDC